MTEEQRATLLAKAADRALVFRAGLLEIEGGGVQAWFVARHPNKLEAMKVRAAWMQSYILNTGWHRSEMERWDDISAAGSAWKAFDNSTIPISNPIRRFFQGFLPSDSESQYLYPFLGKASIGDASYIDN